MEKHTAGELTYDWNKMFRHILLLNLLLMAQIGICAFFLYQYYKRETDIFMTLYVIAVSALALLAYTIIIAHFKIDVRNHILACVLVAFMGPFGGLISLICNTFHLILTWRFKSNFSEWIFSYLFEMDASEKESDKIYNRITAGQEVFGSIDTEPLVDIMDFGTLEQKQAALIKLVRNFTPELMAVLKKALNDPSNAIRVQAAAGLAKLQNDFNRQYTYYERKVIDSTGDVEELKGFARICEEYYNSRMLDQERTAKAVRRSIALYEQAITLEPDDIDLKISLIRILQVNDQTKYAYEILKDIINSIQNPDMETIDTVMQLLMKTGRFAEMKAFASRVSKNSSSLPDGDYLDVWNGRMTPEELSWSNVK
ncbi:MAG: hypothetical protein JXR78_14965 [Victivallales bacterium]|nr:hypothetical protein [Victivallales bacterium]